MGYTRGIFVIAVALLALEVSGGGYKNFLCGKDQSTLFALCDSDCRNDHGSVRGVCGNITEGDYNCYCDKRLNKVPFERSFHCMEGVQPQRSTSVCELDCICNHGAVGGTCDFKLKACVCKNQGSNKENANCPADSVRRFGEIMYTLLGPAELGDEGMAYILKAMAFKM